MDIKEINLERLVSLGSYCNIRIGMTISIKETDKIGDIIMAFEKEVTMATALIDGRINLMKEISYMKSRIDSFDTNHRVFTEAITEEEKKEEERRNIELDQEKMKLQDKFKSLQELVLVIEQDIKEHLNKFQKADFTITRIPNGDVM
jgi:seryl-tRNA synthetase